MTTKSLALEKAAKGYAAAGSASRLGVLLLLVKAGEEGLTVGQIGSDLGIAPSTLAHHLRHLVLAGLVNQEKQGREMRTTANYEHLETLGNFLLSECCKNSRK
jgi:DNA-binding transcriptional ArsR family regulator